MGEVADYLGDRMITPRTDAPNPLAVMINNSALAPLYGQIIMTRVHGKMIVTCAPSVALISPEMISEVSSVIRITDRSRIHLSDQVIYRITGWDRNEKALIVLLEEDHR